MSIRRSALLWLAVLLAIIGVVSAATSYHLMRSESDNFLDSQLRQIAYYIDDAPREPLHSVPSDPLYEPEDDFVVQIWGAGGAKVYDSDPDIAIPRQSRDGFSNIATKSATWRTYSFVTPGRTVQISQDMVVRDELAAGAALRSAVPVMAIFPLSWILLSLVIDRVMRRLRKVISIVQTQDAVTRRPIPLRTVPAEIQPLVRAMNELVDRLQQAMERQRRFVSDAAHELRTPLAALALQLGNLRRVARGRELLSRLADAEAGARRANVLVSQMLRLARYETGQDLDIIEIVDLSVLVQSCVDEIRPVADAKALRLSVALADRPQLKGRASELRVLIANILENAVKYSKPGGIVEVVTAAHPESVVLSVTDSGPGIPPAMAERVFERFVRGADSGTEGSGLGLAIVRSIANRHGIAVELVNRVQAHGLTVRVKARAAEALVPT